MALEFFLPASQDRLIGLDLMEASTDFRRSLCGHAAMLVEFNWVVHHHRLPFTLCTFPILRSPRNRANVKRCKDCAAATHLGSALMGNAWRAPAFKIELRSRIDAFRGKNEVLDSASLHQPF